MADIGYDGATSEDFNYHDSTAGTKNITLCCDYQPTGETGSTTTWSVEIDSYTFDVVKARLRIYEYIPASPKIFALRSSGAWKTITSTGIKSFTESLYVGEGDIIGIEFELTNTSGSAKSIYFGAASTSNKDIFFEYSAFTNGSAYGAGDRWDAITLNASVKLYAALTAAPPNPDPGSGGAGASSTPADGCNDISSTYEVGEYFDNYWGTNGGYIEDIDTASSPKRAMVTVEMPWGWEKLDDEIIYVGTVKTFTNPNNANEHYSLELEVFSGSPSTVYDIVECWWRTNLNDGKYVRAAGDDSLFGNTWNTAYKTVGKGFQNVGENGYLFVEEGLYGGENLSLLNPSNTIQMNIQPMQHDEYPCEVKVANHTLFGAGCQCVSTSSGFYAPSTGRTMFSKLAPFSGSGNITKFCAYAAGSAAGRQCRLKVFRQDGTDIDFVGESALQSFASAGLHTYTISPIAVQKGDYIGLWTTMTVAYENRVSPPSGLGIFYKAGSNITSTTAESTWTYNSGAGYLSLHASNI